MNTVIITGDILKLKSPADGSTVLALATVTSEMVNFNVVDLVEVQEADGLMCEATYELMNDIDYEVIANTETLHSLHEAEYKAILKHMKKVCGPLTTARAVFALKQPGVTTSQDSIQKIIDNAIAEGESRVHLFSEKIEQFKRIAGI
ncbi:MAG: hypothetical protein CTY35_01865 [Methylotenera sp.]|uniref:hypothetical protein n=1 Tax=Methylotenera sp. TaxID=2051956 RepID=UPI000D4CF3D6|nr:hypothetical protein [Methylotenera sp.]PPC84377.1 MAG: hypothetical protein CTY38_02085 [Methylotenera sp.]PPD01019.1 MAG: hypothetical protein CTY35_01865 [Methylotenera sp.]